MYKRNFLLFLCAIVSTCLFCRSENKKEIFLIPASYTGEVIVFFEVKGASSLPNSYHITVFNIPFNGILKTNEKSSEYDEQLSYTFFEKDEKTNKRRLIPYIGSYDDLLKNTPEKKVAYGLRYGSGITNKTNIPTTYLSFLVGKVKEIDSLYNIREHYNSPDLLDK